MGPPRGLNFNRSLMLSIETLRRVLVTREPLEAAVPEKELEDLKRLGLVVDMRDDETGRISPRVRPMVRREILGLPRPLGMDFKEAVNAER